MRAYVIAITMSMLASPVYAANELTFRFSADEFRQKFNAQLKADGGDQTSACQKSRGQMLCVFKDDGFQKSVKAFKGTSEQPP